ncbi:SMC5-SMC6 complex localization factor protein 2 isoform X2 [Anabas testudineus]|uniref:SMC5-SMC6 complex localization factor protein 2 isoform X2 n=1 Tax=Anabas testudineus TaxID=64144 RepID=UPI000E4594BD|nr:SMC5-SMC6 complex localization factor protein 2 isoform X2 [Anabas testudineus]
MRKATENQGNTRTRTEHFSPKCKGKELAFQQHIQPNFISSHQETPMKPSQVPNRLSQPPPRRILPMQSPELCPRDRLGSPWHPSHTLGPFQPSGIVPSSPTSIGRPHPTPRDRQGPPQHSAQLQSVPVIPTKIDTSANRPQHPPPHMFHHTSPQYHTPSSHIKRDQVTESKVVVSYSGTKTVTTKSKDSNKAQSSDAKSSIPTVQLHRSPLTPSLNSQAAQHLCARTQDSEQWSPGTIQWPSQGYELPPTTQSSDTSIGSSLLNMQCPVASDQDQQHKPTPSSKTQIPVVDLNSLSQKRRRDFEHSDDTAKKLCVQGPSKAQTPKPTVGTTLSTSQALPSRPSPVLELSPRTDGNAEPFDPSTCVEPSATHSSCASLSPKISLKRHPPTGAKQVLLNSCQNHIVKLRSPLNFSQDNLKKSEENNEQDKSSTLLSPEIPQKDTGSSAHVLLGSHQSGHIHCSKPVEPVKTPSRSKQVEESRKHEGCIPKTTSKPKSASLSCHRIKHNKTAHQRRHAVIPNDVDELFTPDPMTYVVSPTQKTVKPMIDGGTVKSPTSEKNCSFVTASSSLSPVTVTSCQQNCSSNAVDARVSSSEHNPQVCLPTVVLVRVKPALKNTEQVHPKKEDLKNSSITSSGRQLREKGVKSDEKCTSLILDNVSSHTSRNDISASKQTVTSSQSPPLERQASGMGGKQVNEDDPIDVELGLSFALDLDITQSSHSSEEEQLLSLQEMMERVTKPPDTPEKGAFSEPSTPGHRSCQLKVPLQSTTNSGIYKNSLDQMLKEINTNKKAKEIEAQLLTACKEDLLRIAEYEEAEENQEEGISTEQQEFLQRYSLMSSAIREVPPGEVVFNLEKFGQIFDQDTLQLRQCKVNPQGTAQKTLLWSSPAQLRLHVTIGLFQEAYDCCSPCPTQVTRFLFKMMSVHSERLVSEMMLQALCDIACTAAFQRVKNGNQQFKVWVPSLADVTLVLMNMGVAFVTLFPFENLQPSFTEGDLLEDEHIKIESPSSNKEPSPFPEHNCNNILKYLSYCMGLCPRAYSDDELLLLLTVVGRIGLDTRLILHSSVELYPLQYKIVNNIRNWDTMLPRICQALTDLTDDHHNMCLLVQMLPDNTRGKQLRRHLSLSMISKLLDGNCTYRSTEKEFQLSNLRPYLPRMQPSTILRAMLSNSSKSQKDKEEDMAILDQQAYYLCYSLLTLANEASNFQFFPAQQKKQLLSLCSELETHVKCDIRESEKCLYRSKVKDLVARIYTKWQMLLQRTRPLHGKLYDYWEPLSSDAFIGSQAQQASNNSDEEEPEMDGTNGSETNEVVMVDEDEVQKDEEQKEEERLEGQEDMKMNEKLKMGRASPVNDLCETEDAVDLVPGELSQAMLEGEPEVQRESKAMDEQTCAGNTEHVKVQAENVVDKIIVTSHQNQVAACDLVS